MSLIDFPNVPALPGVPPLRRALNVSPVARTVLGVVQGLLWRAFQVDTRWGIFDKNGKALANPAKFTGIIGGILDGVGLGSTLSTGAVDYSKETRVSDFPVERGSFASYNKVEQPAMPVVTLCLSGSEADRRKFLRELDKAVKSTDLYSIATPEITYIDYSIERISMQRRSNRGATLLTVDVALKEIRQVSAVYTKSNPGKVDAPKNPAATPMADAGKVQAATPDVSTLKSIANKIPSLAEKAGTYLRGL